MSEPPEESRTLGRFRQAIRSDAPCPPENLRAWNSAAPVRRFDVYRNNVRQGLIGALATRYPVAAKLVGEDFFSSLAEAFIAENPPRSPVLLEWGDALADFTAGFEPSRPVPYLADVMRIEDARSRAYHSADVEPLPPEAFARLLPEDLGLVRLEPHPALAILRSSYPAVTIWERHQDDARLGPIDDWRGEDALITRPATKVELRRLPPGCAVFLDRLRTGTDLGSAAEAAAQSCEDFDLAVAFAILIESGAFCALYPEKPAQ